MDPDQQPYQYSVDYLNQIAPQAPKPGVSSKLKWIIIGLIGALIVALILMAVSTLSLKPDTDEVMAARLKETATIASKAQRNIKSSQLRGYNSNLTLYLSNTNRTMAEQLTTRGIDPKKLTESITSAESARAKEVSDKLEDARLNAIYDRTYSREMAFQLETIIALMQAAYKDTNSSAYKEYLDTSYKNLAPIQKQIADFNEASN